MLVTATIWLLIGASVGIARSNRPLVLVVLDGFRWDYQELLPSDSRGGLHLLQTAGVRAEHVMPIFPSVSFASWTSIATGRWAETHGIVGNNIYDSELGLFSLYNRTRTGRPGWWNSGSDPIWTTATQQQVKTAVIGFSRCDVVISGVTPAFCEAFDKGPGEQILRDRLALALSKLNQEFEFVIVYAEYLDTIGHYSRPEGAKMRRAVQVVDEELMVFFNSLRQRKLFDKVNCILTSDHGMTEIGQRVNTNFQYLDLYLSPLLAQMIIDRGAFTQIISRADNRQQILRELARMPNVTVYTKDEFPEEWHYANNPRIPEILVLADPGTVIVGPQTDNALPRDEPGMWDKVRGIHGYTGNLTDMRTIFYAIGPDFKSGYRQSPMEMVDIYQLLAHLLHIEPQPHNGTWQRVENMLSAASPRHPPPGGFLLLSLVALLVSRKGAAAAV